MAASKQNTCQSRTTQPMSTKSLQHYPYQRATALVTASK